MLRDHGRSTDRSGSSFVPIDNRWRCEKLLRSRAVTHDQTEDAPRRIRQVDKILRRACAPSSSGRSLAHLPDLSRLGPLRPSHEYDSGIHETSTANYHARSGGIPDTSFGTAAAERQQLPLQKHHRSAWLDQFLRSDAAWDDGGQNGCASAFSLVTGVNGSSRDDQQRSRRAHAGFAAS